MYKGGISSTTAITASTNIPFTTIKATSNDVVFDSTNNVLVFNRPGRYQIFFHAVATNVAAGDITISEMIGGTASATSAASDTSSGTSDYFTLDIPDILDIYPSSGVTKVQVGYQSDVAASISSALLTVVRVGR